jgi:hypothetical protein
MQCCEAESQSGAAAAAAASPSSSGAAQTLAALRKRILLKPMRDSQTKTATSCSLRGHVWQLLLGAALVPASQYEALVSRGPCLPRELYSKIRGDLFRTFQDDELFWRLVDEPAMSRVLNAFVQHQNSTPLKTIQGTEKRKANMRGG